MWLIIVLASLVVLCFLFLCIPLDLAFRLDVHDKTKFSMKLVWMFGFIKKELGGRKKKAKPKKAKIQEAEGKKRGAGKAIGFLRTKGLLGQIKILVTDVWKSLSIRQLRVNFRIGFDDPADTGMLFAFLGPTFIFFNNTKSYSVDIIPSFEDDAVLEGYMQAVIRLLPIRLVFSLLRFIFSFPTLRVIKEMAVTKWKRK